ncbi:MAG: shikimate dehydrogenase [Actinobacteria bacterium]|nr:shikimate dehydrogenase [Actinomycetota bacterium]
MRISGNTKLVGILGHPVSHTLSPLMNNAAFEAMGLDICYVPLDVAPEGLQEGITGMKAMGFLGANVTIPHKIEAARMMDKLEGIAAITGAVNTIVNDSGSLIGHNTDGDGFIRALAEAVDIDFPAAQPLLMGAGGAARSIALALAGKNIKRLTIVNRSRQRSEDLKALIAKSFPGLPVETVTFEDDLAGLISSSNIVINATSIGLEGYLKMPQVPVDRLTKDHVVCDIVYTQTQETPFLTAARGKGATTLGGLGMLLHQGAAAIQLWTGVEPPIDVMRGAIESKRTDNSADSQEATANRRDPGGQGSY